MRLRLLAAASLVALAACSTPPPAHEDDAEAPPPEGRSTNPTEAVPLRVVMTDQTTTGEVMLIRGKIMNPHSQPVTGVRLQLVFVSPGGEDSGKVQDILQKELGSTIAPGGSTPFSWDVESMYAYGANRFVLAAYPKRLGDKDMPPPDHWKD